jgi:hypothetical protein
VLLTLEKNSVSRSEVYVAGLLDQKLSQWFSQRLKDAGLRAGAGTG